jgi:ornithine cyclodeaminase/alanine dehydrogenase-like protein (mu-crystallin family)
MNSWPKHSLAVSSMTRRRFLAAAGAAAAVLPRTTWAKAGPVSASDKITIGVIGWGMMGPANTKAFLEQSDCRVVAACDLDKKHLKAAVDTINQKYGNTDCKAYRDYRELLARDDIDAVMTPFLTSGTPSWRPKRQAGKRISTARSLSPAPSPSSRPL